jgi:alkyldihydroxyacetonephosphate synthase
MFMRSVPNPPDAVSFPESEQDIVRVLDWCDQIGAKAIPYGGGSSVVKGIEPSAAFEKVVTISMRHMDKVLEGDPVSQAARIQGGVYGPHLEDRLRDTPFTMRHYMQAYRCSTLGGWIATRSGGHYATLYTHIDDFVESTRVVTPVGTRRRAGCRLRRGGPARPDVHRLEASSALSPTLAAAAGGPTFRAATAVRFKISMPALTQCVASPRQVSILPTAGCSRYVRRCPTLRRGTKKLC